MFLSRPWATAEEYFPVLSNGGWGGRKDPWEEIQRWFSFIYDPSQADSLLDRPQRQNYRTQNRRSPWPLESPEQHVFSGSWSSGCPYVSNTSGFSQLKNQLNIETPKHRSVAVLKKDACLLTFSLPSSFPPGLLPAPTDLPYRTYFNSELNCSCFWWSIIDCLWSRFQSWLLTVWFGLFHKLFWTSVSTSIQLGGKISFSWLLKRCKLSVHKTF